MTAAIPAGRVTDTLGKLVWWCAVVLAPLQILFCLGWKPAAYTFVAPYDDAYYYLKIAQNIAQGQGSTFDGLEPTNGYHPLWMTICVAVAWLVRGLIAYPVVLAMIQVVLAAGGIWLLERSWRRSLSPLLSACAALLVVAQAYWAFHDLMETGVDLLFLAGLSWIVLHDGACEWLKGRAAWLASAIFLGVCLARLDNALLVAGAIGGLFMAWLTRDGWSVAIRSTWRLGWPLAAGFGAYLVFNKIEFGAIMPISGQVKQSLAFHPGADPSALRRGVAALISTLQGGVRAPLTYLSIWLAPVLVPALIIKAVRGRSPECWMLAGLLAGLLLNYLYYAFFSVEGLFVWYGLPYIIASVYLIFRGLAWMLSRFGESEFGLKWRTLAAAGVAVLVLAVFAGRMRNDLNVARQAVDVRQAEANHEMLELAARYPGARVGAWNAGLTGYLFGGRATNLDGLVNDPEYFHQYLYHYKTADYIQDRQFDFIIDADKFLGYQRLRDQHWAGMDEGQYRQLLEQYELAYVADNAAGMKMIILVRKDLAQKYFGTSTKVLRVEDLHWAKDGDGAALPELSANLR